MAAFNQIQHSWHGKSVTMKCIMLRQYYEMNRINEVLTYG